MSQVLLLKINADGVPQEFSSSADEITLASYTVNGGLVASSTGIDMNNTDLSDVQDVSFTNPATGTINQTAGALIIDDLMAKERDNVMASTGAVLFGLVADSAAQLDSFKLPDIAGIPTATPAFSAAAGYLVYDSVGKDLYAWDGSAWDNLNTVDSAGSVLNQIPAGEAISARDIVYISADDTVSKAKADAEATSHAIGFAEADALLAAPVNVISNGIISGFSGLTANTRYYLSGATAGGYSASAPTGSGHILVQVGFALSTSKMFAQFLNLGRRA